MSGPIDWDGLVLGPCMDVFGEAVTYVPVTGRAVPMVGVFDAAFVDVKFSGGEPTEDTKPMLGCRLAAFPFGLAPPEGARFIIRGQGWTVTTTDVDGHGHVKVFLHGPVVL